MSPFTGRNNEIVMLKKRRQFTEKGGMSLANRNTHKSNNLYTDKMRNMASMIKTGILF